MIRELLARAFVADYSGNQKWAENKFAFGETFYILSAAEQLHLMLEQAKLAYPTELDSVNEENIQQQIQDILLAKGFWPPSHSFAYSSMLGAFLTFASYKFAFHHVYATVYAERFRSFSQLWLAFYMEQTHNLRWNGTEWRKPLKTDTE